MACWSGLLAHREPRTASAESMYILVCIHINRLTSLGTIDRRQAGIWASRINARAYITGCCARRCLVATTSESTPPMIYHGAIMPVSSTKSYRRLLGKQPHTHTHTWWTPSPTCPQRSLWRSQHLASGWLARWLAGWLAGCSRTVNTCPLNKSTLGGCNQTNTHQHTCKEAQAHGKSTAIS